MLTVLILLISSSLSADHVLRRYGTKAGWKAVSVATLVGQRGGDSQQGEEQAVLPKKTRLFDVCNRMLQMFYQSVMASVLFFGITCWGGTTERVTPSTSTDW